MKRFSYFKESFVGIMKMAINLQSVLPRCALRILKILRDGARPAFCRAGQPVFPRGGASIPDCCPLLPIVAHCYPLLSTFAHCCPLLPTVAHCCPLFPIVVPLVLAMLLIKKDKFCSSALIFAGTAKKFLHGNL